MTMTRKPLSYYLAPVASLLAVLAATANWYLQPDRAAAWAAAIVWVSLAWGVATFLVRRQSRQNQEAHDRASHLVRQGLTFAGTIILISLSVTLAGTLGAIDETDLSRRAANVIAGAFMVFMGNAMPKMLTPLAQMQCHGSRMQAFQRFTGWTWVLTGLAYALAWIALPIGIAKPASMAMVLAGLLVAVAQIARLARTRRNSPPPAEA
jgi:hypothetical protein